MCISLYNYMYKNDTMSWFDLEPTVRGDVDDMTFPAGHHPAQYRADAIQKTLRQSRGCLR